MPPRFTNRPPHLFLENQIYFISARTQYKHSYFNTNQKKKILSSVINEATKRFQVEVYAWTILANHYHLLCKFQNSKDLSKFIQNIHINSARLVNKLENSPGRRIWFNYWDRCMRNEKDFWKHFNYIHHNPVKHGYIENQDLVKNYQFCSYQQWLKKEGYQWIVSCFAQYPIIDFTTKGEI